MFKKFIWIFILLVMTACTIVFGEQADLRNANNNPEAHESFFPAIKDLFAKREADPVEEPILIEELTPIEESFPEVTAAPVELVPEESKEPTPVILAESEATYIVQEGSPTYLANFNYLDKGCAWQGVAGQVFDADGVPVKYLIVKVFGTWKGKEISKLAVTGMVDGKPYGKGSYEVVLGKVAVDSTTPLYIQVFDSDGSPLSEPFEFATKAKCNRNLVLINFVHD